jgi:Flp pilus assembly protein TadD
VLAWLLAVPPVLADLHYYAGRPAAAVGAWPWQARYHHALADVLDGSERLDELRKAGRLGSSDTGLWIALGDAEASSGDPEAARRDWQRAVEIYPYDRGARERLGMSAAP